MIALTIFLVTLSIMFSAGKGAPSLFGSNLYFVKRNSFDLIPAPSVVTGKMVDTASLGVGNIIIFEIEGTSNKSIGGIIEITQEDNPNDPEKTIRYFKVEDEQGYAEVIPETAVISKAVRTSRIMGSIVSFVSSPTGVLVIAVIPCICLILSDVFKSLFRKLSDKKEISPINKQNETPTFIPQAKTEQSADEIEPQKLPGKYGKSAAALKAYKDALNITNTQETGAPPLFTATTKPQPLYEKPAEFTETLTAASEINASKKKPLSSVKLAEAIAAVNARRETNDDIIDIEQLTASEKSKRINQVIAEYSGKNKKEE